MITKEILERELQRAHERADDSGSEFVWLAEHKKDLVDAGSNIHPSHFELGEKIITWRKETPTSILKKYHG